MQAGAFPVFMAQTHPGQDRLVDSRSWESKGGVNKNFILFLFNRT